MADNEMCLEFDNIRGTYCYAKDGVVDKWKAKMEKYRKIAFGLKSTMFGIIPLVFTTLFIALLFRRTENRSGNGSLIAALVGSALVLLFAVLFIIRLKIFDKMEQEDLPHYEYEPATIHRIRYTDKNLFVDYLVEEKERTLPIDTLGSLGLIVNEEILFSFSDTGEYDGKRLYFCAPESNNNVIKYMKNSRMLFPMKDTDNFLYRGLIENMRYQ